MGIDALLDTLERSDVVKILRAIDAEQDRGPYGFVRSRDPARCCAEIAGDLVDAMYYLPSGVDWHEWAPDLGTIERVRLSDDGRCAYCGRHRTQLDTDEYLQVDHVHPVSLGGTDDMGNLTTSCSTCNLGKAAQSLPEQDAIEVG